MLCLADNLPIITYFCWTLCFSSQRQRGKKHIAKHLQTSLKSLKITVDLLLVSFQSAGYFKGLDVLRPGYLKDRIYP